ncbi:MAG: hypothetical protein NTY48_05860 [Candidatus Diapherotrites archaeon]|nr:hypothetical protein [Candidatus Diapherotrites archaeon]
MVVQKKAEKVVSKNSLSSQTGVSQKTVFPYHKTPVASSPVHKPHIVSSPAHKSLATSSSINKSFPTSSAPASELVLMPGKVPSARELVLVVDKKKDKPKKKNFALILAVVVLVLIVILVVFALFFMPKYKYSFNNGGVEFVSNEFTPSEFFPKFRSNDSFVVSIDLKFGESNSWTVNAMNLWVVALNADKKNVHFLVRSFDAQGKIVSCMTNDANILSSRELSTSECGALLNDSNKGLVIIRLASEDSAVLSKNKLEIFASGTKTISMVNYIVIKEIYPDFDQLLAIINERINSVN